MCRSTITCITQTAAASVHQVTASASSLWMALPRCNKPVRLVLDWAMRRMMRMALAEKPVRKAWPKAFWALAWTVLAISVPSMRPARRIVLPVAMIAVSGRIRLDPIQSRYAARVLWTVIGNGPRAIASSRRSRWLVVWVRRLQPMRRTILTANALISPSLRWRMRPPQPKS